MTKEDETQVMLRVHADTKDLDIAWAKILLGLSEQDPALKGIFEYPDGEGIVGCVFNPGKPFVDSCEVECWYRPVFRVATEWLKTRSRDVFLKIREAGSRTDVLVLGYEGYVPAAFLKEIVRLDVDLFVMRK